MRFTAKLAAIFLLLCFALLANAQDAKTMNVNDMKFVNLPVLPPCSSLSVTKGDPASGPFTALVKGNAGCDIPMHFHSFDEQLMIVSGTVNFQMKDGAVQALRPGGFVNTPAKHPHHVTCSNLCQIYLVSAGAFDIHYIDAAGKELPLDQAMKASKKLGGRGITVSTGKGN